MKTLIFTLALSVTSLSWGATVKHACSDFSKISHLVKTVTPAELNEIIPRNDWLDTKFKYEDRRKVAGLVAKTIVGALSGSLSPLTFAMSPTRAGVASFTGMYVSNEENFAKFLTLEPRSACQYLSMSDRHAEMLREMTHEVWTHLDLSRAHR